MTKITNKYIVDVYKRFSNYFPIRSVIVNNKYMYNEELYIDLNCVIDLYSLEFYSLQDCYLSYAVENVFKRHFLSKSELTEKDKEFVIKYFSYCPEKIFETFCKKFNLFSNLLLLKKLTS